MDNTIKKEVLALVKDIFSEKEEAEMKKRTEDALQEAANTVSDLTDALAAKDTEVSSLESEVQELKVSLEEAQSKLEAASEEAKAKDTSLEKVQLELSDLKKNIAADTRMTELEKAGVARSDKESQRSKVFEMTDEEFTSYKEELVAIRASVKAELEEAAAKAKEEADKAAGSKKGDDEDNNNTPPAKIDDVDKNQAALNLETASDEKTKKYENLGKALAEMIARK